MKTREIILSAAALIVLCVPSAFAQQSDTTLTPTPTDKPRRSAAQRQPAGSHRARELTGRQLTAGETKNLETKEAGVNKEEHTMRAEDDGHLTVRRPHQAQQPAEPLVQPNLRRQAQRNTAHNGNGEIGQRRQEPAGPHRAGSKERPTDGRRNGEARKPATGHKP